MLQVYRMMEGIAIPHDLPGTLQSELEMSEKLICGRRTPSKDSVDFIKFSSSLGTSGKSPKYMKRQRSQSSQSGGIPVLPGSSGRQLLDERPVSTPTGF